MIKIRDDQIRPGLSGDNAARPMDQFSFDLRFVKEKWLAVVRRKVSRALRRVTRDNFFQLCFSVIVWQFEGLSVIRIRISNEDVNYRGQSRSPRLNRLFTISYYGAA